MYGGGHMQNAAMMQGAQMQMMQGGMGMGGLMGMNMNMMNSPSYFTFVGTPQSFQARVDNMTDEQINQLLDANITITGIEIQPMNMMSYMCTVIWGSIILIPIFFMCMPWWKRCTYPIYEVPEAVYNSLYRIFRASRINNVSLNVNDNGFGPAKAGMLYDMISQSSVKGFSFNNMATDVGIQGDENSRFEANVMPIKSLTTVISDIRWPASRYC